MPSILDSAAFNERLFMPRADTSMAGPGAVDMLVPVDGAELHLRWHCRFSGAATPTLLLFHGNGETVADYDPIARSFEACGARLAVVDYRGYGQSTGTPSLRSLMRDAGVVAAHLERAGADQLIVMGRSLGSICAAALYAQDDANLLGVIFESGFTDLDALIRRRGFDPEADAGQDRSDFDVEAKLRRGTRPFLVIHGENDKLIVPSEGERAFMGAGTHQKKLLLVPGRGHNDVSLHAAYWDAIRTLIKAVSPS